VSGKCEKKEKIKEKKEIDNEEVWNVLKGR
jgi:hypothetical protein